MTRAEADAAPSLGSRADFEAVFLFNPPGHLHSHCATIVETGGGDLLAAWYAYAAEETSQAAVVLARRPRGQPAWTEAQTVASSRHSCGNPVLFEDPAGLLWLLYVVLEGPYWDSAVLHGAWSDDGGRTWAPPAVLPPRRHLMIRHSPVAAAGGALLLPAYEERPPSTVILRAEPPYRNWVEIYRFAEWELIQPVLLRRVSGELAAYFRPTGDPRCVWRSASSDDGRTWASPIRTPLGNPLSGIAAFSWGGGDTLVFNPASTNRHRLAASCSRDGGLSWSPAAILDNSEMEVSYPAFIVDAGGRAHGVYTYNRRMIKYVSFAADWWKA